MDDAIVFRLVLMLGRGGRDDQLKAAARFFGVVVVRYRSFFAQKKCWVEGQFVYSGCCGVKTLLFRNEKDFCFPLDMIMSFMSSIPLYQLIGVMLSMNILAIASNACGKQNRTGSVQYG